MGGSVMKISLSLAVLRKLCRRRPPGPWLMAPGCAPAGAVPLHGGDGQGPEQGPTQGTPHGAPHGCGSKSIRISLYLAARRSSRSRASRMSCEVVQRSKKCIKSTV